MIPEVRVRFPAKLDGPRLSYAAIRGILDALGDSHTTFADPQRARQQDDDIRGGFDGIGISVEIRDVAIPVALQDAMSRQAQAEREKQARVILGSAEAEIAGKFVEAARTYGENPAAMQLRAMNIIYETTKERGTTILIPSSLVDSLNTGAFVRAARPGASSP